MRVHQGGQPPKRVEMLNDPAIEVGCPICEAARGVGCHIRPGIARFDSHLERKKLAEERRIVRLDLNKVLTLLAARQSLENGKGS